MNKIVTLENLEIFAEINDALKADKAVEAITGNLAKFDENGNPVDSGININDLSLVATTGDYNDLLNKPSIPSVGNAEIEIQKNGTKINSFTTNQSGSKVAINITVPTGTAADKNVPSSGDASSTQVVLGNDSRLTNARPASDVSSWAKASSKPSYTKNEVGLGNVTNDAQVKRTEMGAASGVATLGTDGKVPSSQLPSYVDDVLEYAKLSSFPATGESGKIYVAQDTNKTYRWSGSAYVEISPSIVIGTTTGTAADGKTANDHYSNTSNPHSVTKAQVGLGSVVNTGDSATPVSGGTTKFTTGGAYTELAKKVDKVTGKGLSTNDYTTDEKNKLAGIASGAEVNVQSDWNAESGDAFIKNKPTSMPASDVYSWAKASSKPSYTASEVGLGNVGNFKAVSTVASQGLSSTEQANARANIGAGTSSFSGNYNDLSNKPTIPAAVTESTVSDWGFTKNTGTITGIKMNGSSKGTSGVVDLGTVITTHQDISGKVDKTTTVNGHALSDNISVTKSDVGLGSVGNFKAVSTVASQGLTDAEKSNARANIGAGTSSFSGSYNDLSNKPSIPAAANNGTFTVKTLVGSTTTNVSDFTANQSSADDVTFVQGSNVTITPDATNRKITIAAKDTTYSSKAAASGGTDVSLVTTGEKYAWNSKTSNTGTVTKVTAGTGLTGGDITTTGTIALATSGVTAGTYKRVTVDAYGRVTSGDNTDADTNTAKLQVSDTTNKRINTKESTGNYIQFTGGTNKFTVGDGTNSFDVAITPSVSFPVSSVAGNTGAVTTAQIASALTSAGYKLTDSDTKYNFSGTSFTSNNSTATNANDVTYNAHTYYTSNGPSTSLGASTDDGALYSQAYSTSWVAQIAQDYRNGGLYVRGKNNGTWQSWYKIWDSRNLTNLNQLSNGPGYITGITKTMVTNALGYTPPTADTNTWRPVSDSVNSTESGTAASSKAVKTAYDLAASKTSNTGTVTSVAAGTGLSGGTITTSGTLSVAYGTTAGTACQGNDSRLSNSRPASDVYSWAKASSKPTYIASEVMSISAQSISANTSSSCSITGSGNAGKAQTIIYVNGGSSDVTVTVPTTYSTPNGEAIELTCPVGGYCEVSYLNIGGTIYARGL